MTAYFVTSTGTGIGKTHLTCGLIEALRRRDVAVDAIKPVISGYRPEAAEDSDTALILRALGLPFDEPRVKEISPWRFLAALSPDMAALREGRSVVFEEVVEFCRTASDVEDGLCLIEGAGGVMAPLGHAYTNLDLMTALDVRIVLVAGTYLGTISHTLTACEALSVRGREPWAVVLSESEDSPVPPTETAQSIGRFISAPIYLLPRGSSAPEDLVDAMLS
ncbi:MAG: dethiobiotin synthase [Alphaproteobacteria bacterium]|nr:dethiobiotin synthase [Alphaproteobacteria bacterium]